MSGPGVARSGRPPVASRRPPPVASRRRLLAVFGASFAALLPSACGFRPRGSLVAVDESGRLFLDADRGLSIEEALREALAERAFALAVNRDEADVVLRVTDERQTQRIVSVRSTGRVSEYQLAHAVSVAISRDESPPASGSAPSPAAPGEPARVVDGTTTGAAAEGDVADAGPVRDVESVSGPVPPRADRVEVTREYTYDESQVLGKENEARILRGEMGDELVRQIVLRTVASLARTAAEPEGRAGVTPPAQ